MKLPIALTLAALAGSASMASAETYFTLPQAQQRDGTAELGAIVTDKAGVLEIYALRAGETGTLIGSEPLHAGANGDVRVDVLSGVPMKMALAAIVVDGEVVATQRLRSSDD